jgi:COMPASS component SWD3
MSELQPSNTDAILGGQNPAPIDTAILGGIDGLKQRIASKDENLQISALHEALKYDDSGVELLIQVWEKESSNLKWQAFSLLREREEEKVKNALAAHNPWVNLSCIHTWEQNAAVKCIIIDREGNSLFSGNGFGINVLDLRSKQQGSLSLQHSNTSAIAIAADGKTLISRGGYYDYDNRMKVWNIQTGECTALLNEYGYMVYSLTINSQNQSIVCGSVDYRINVWSVETNQVIRSISNPKYLVQALAISNDGEILVSGGNDKKVKIWNFDTGELLKAFKHTDGVESVAISPDKQIVVSGSKDKTVKVWNLQTKKIQFTLEGHTGLVYCVAISPDGNYIFSCGRDKTIKVWDLHTGECMNTLKGHADWVYCLAVSPDGKTLVSSSRDKTVKIWQRQD